MSEEAEKLIVELPSVGPYQLIERLPTRGVVESYVARHEDRAELVILKRLLAEHRGNGAEESRFVREAEITVCLDHPNLVVGLERGEAHGAAFVVTELVVGFSFRTVLSALAARGEKLPVKHFMKVAEGVLAGLHHAHEAEDPTGRALGIVHRDLSPENLLVTLTGDVRIKDFALARARAGEFATAVGLSVGKAAYLSPEQARGYPLDRRSDLYTLGVTFFELLLGRPVVAESGLMSAIRKVLDKDPPPLRPVRPDVPAEVEKVLRIATAKSAHDRYRNAEEMRKALASAARKTRPSTSAELGRFVRSILPKEEARVGGLADAARADALDLPDWMDDADTVSLDRGPHRPSRAARNARSLAVASILAAAVASAFVAGRWTGLPLLGSTAAVPHRTTPTPSPSASSVVPPNPDEPDEPDQPEQPIEGDDFDLRWAAVPDEVPQVVLLKAADADDPHSPELEPDPAPPDTAPPAELADEEVIIELQKDRTPEPSEPEAATHPLIEQLAEIGDHEEFAEAFARLHDVLSARAKYLPADQRVVVEAELAVAREDQDVQSLARALSHLPRMTIWPPAD